METPEQFADQLAEFNAAFGAPKTDPLTSWYTPDTDLEKDRGHEIYIGKHTLTVNDQVFDCEIYNDKMLDMIRILGFGQRDNKGGYTNFEHMVSPEILRDTTYVSGMLWQTIEEKLLNSLPKKKG